MNWSTRIRMKMDTTEQGEGYPVDLGGSPYFPWLFRELVKG